LALCFALPIAAAAQDPRVPFLEQEVRELQRQVRTLSRQMDEIRNRPARPIPHSAIADSPSPAPDPEQWLDAAKWKQLKVGMNELEVIGLLGPPTSMRERNGSRVLFYALEIGSTGFLGGRVSLRDRVVTEVQTPTLN
jgi:hypothetical protein